MDQIRRSDLSLDYPLRYQHSERASAQNLYEKSMTQETSEIFGVYQSCEQALIV